MTIPLSVVIVDKHPMMRTAISTAVSSTDRLSVMAEYADCSDFLHTTSHAMPHVILLGIGNPGLDELSMVRVLRRSCPTAKVLVLLSGELPGQEEVALRYGAHYVLEKTVSRDELLNLLMNRFQKTTVSALYGEENG